MFKRKMNEVASKLTKTVLDTGVSTVKTGIKSMIISALFSIGIWIIGLTVVILGIIYTTGILFN